MPKKLEKEVVEDDKEEAEEFLDDAPLPVENDDIAYEEDLETEGEVEAEEPAGEWVDE